MGSSELDIGPSILSMSSGSRQRDSALLCNYGIEKIKKNSAKVVDALVQWCHDPAVLIQ